MAHRDPKPPTDKLFHQGGDRGIKPMRTTPALSVGVRKGILKEAEGPPETESWRESGWEHSTDFRGGAQLFPVG